MMCEGTALWPIGADGRTTGLVIGTCPKCLTQQTVEMDGGMTYHHVPPPVIPKADLLKRFVI